MTAASVSTVPTETAAPTPSDKLLDGILSGTLSRIAAVPAKISAETPHPLEDVEDVEAAKPIIEKLLIAERNAGGKRVYPRRILRQQHIVAYMLCNPFATNTEVCAFFGISPSTLGNIAKSDTFKALINAHKLTLDSNVAADLQEQMRLTLAVSLEVTQKAVVTNQDPEYALAVMDKVANRLGMGAKHNTQVQINNNIVTPEMIAAARARRLPNAS